MKTMQRQPQLSPTTLVHSCKDRYIIRSQHGMVGQIHFKPPCSSEARDTVKKEFIHSLGDSQALFEERSKLINQKLR